MTKNIFQRLLALFIILLVWLINIPSIFKDGILILLAITLFISTFDIYKRRNKDIQNNA